jgi:hypothetical protein
LSEEVICALLRDFRQHGQRAIEKVRQTQPGAYLKVLALLVPREHKVEHTNAVSELSDEQLEAMIEHIQERLERRAAAAKTIDGELVEPALPPPADTTSSGRNVGIYEHPAMAVGPGHGKARVSKKRPFFA